LGGSIIHNMVGQGKAFLMFSGLVRNTGGNGGATISGRLGLYPGPSIGAPATGGQFGSTQHPFMASSTDWQSFSIFAIISGFTVGSTYWFDLAINSTTGNNLFLQDVQFAMIEF
jgi:fructose-specific phosphotransferase system IIC component